MIVGKVSRFCLGCMGFGEVREGALHTWTLGPDDTRAIIGRALNASLKRLGLDTVDLYHLHSWDYHTPIEDIMRGGGERTKKRAPNPHHRIRL